MKNKEITNKQDKQEDGIGKKEGKIYSDVNGSYTGRPVDGGKPVQDADDL